MPDVIKQTSHPDTIFRSIMNFNYDESTEIKSQLEIYKGITIVINNGTFINIRGQDKKPSQTEAEKFYDFCLLQSKYAGNANERSYWNGMILALNKRQFPLTEEQEQKYNQLKK